MTAQVSMTGAASLGILQDASPFLCDESESEEKKRARYVLTSRIAERLVWNSTMSGRMLQCGRAPAPGHRVILVHNEINDKYYRKNIFNCGYVWLCPACSARLTNLRRYELSSVIERFEGTVLMGAFTVGHHAGDELSITKKIVDSACGSIFSGSVGQRLKNESDNIGTISANEVTWSIDNGWHPHRHVLFLFGHKLSKDEIRAFEERVRERYDKQVKKNHGYTVGEYGVNIAEGTNKREVSDYCFKFGITDELLSFQRKEPRGANGYTPFELAGMYFETGKMQYWALFADYIRAFSGKSRVTYSRGLKALLGLKEITDKALLVADEMVAKEPPIPPVPPEEYEPKGYGGGGQVIETVIADFTRKAVRVISEGGNWASVTGICKGAHAQELSFIDVGVLLVRVGLRAVQYDNGVMGLFSSDEPPPNPSRAVLEQEERIILFKDGGVG